MNNSITTQICCTLCYTFHFGFVYVYGVRNAICNRYAVLSLDNNTYIRSLQCYRTANNVNCEYQIFHFSSSSEWWTLILFGWAFLTRKLQFPNKSNEFRVNVTWKNSMHIFQWWKIKFNAFSYISSVCWWRNPLEINMHSLWNNVQMHWNPVGNWKP